MEWTGETYEIHGTKEQVDRIQKDLEALPGTQMPSGLTACSHKDVIAAYFPYDRKESYAGDIAFNRKSETCIVLDDMNNYDGFSLRPAFVERYGTLSFRSVFEHSLYEEQVSVREEHHLDTITLEDAAMMRADNEAERLIPEGVNFKNKEIAEFKVTDGVALNPIIERMYQLKAQGNAPVYGFTVYDSHELRYFGPLAKELGETKLFELRREGKLSYGLADNEEVYFVIRGLPSDRLQQIAYEIHALADRKALQKSTRTMLEKFGTADGPTLSKGL